MCLLYATHFYRFFKYVNLFNIYNELMCNIVFVYSSIDEEMDENSI